MTSNDQTRRRVIEILKNHAREETLLLQRLANEDIALMNDMDAILSKAYPTSAAPDAGVHVTTSAVHPDEKLITIVDERSKRTQMSEMRKAPLRHQLQQIYLVEEIVQQLDTNDKCALTALYYPNRTYDEAAKLLGMDRSTLRRHAAIAINRLVQRADRTGMFYGGER